MNDPTPHQRDIVIAMLQGMRIEGRYVAKEVSAFWDCGSEFHFFDTDKTLDALRNDAYELRVAPNQCEAVRLYGYKYKDLDKPIDFRRNNIKGDTHYIDISHNGFIVGGKIEDIAK